MKQVVAADAKGRFSLSHIHAPEQPSKSTSDAPNEPPTHDDATSTLSNLSLIDPTDNDPSHYLIRANQGHSVKVEDEGLHKPITLEAGNLPDVVVHGTRKELWRAIEKTGGLKSMTRNHVHFATGVPEALRASFPSSAQVSSKTTAAASTSDGEETREGGEVEALLPDNEASTVKSGMRNSSTVLMFLDLRGALESGNLKFWLSENGVVLSQGDETGIVPLEYFSVVEEKGGNVLLRNG